MCAGSREKGGGKMVILKNMGIYLFFFYLRDFVMSSNPNPTNTHRAHLNTTDHSTQVFHSESYHIQHTLTVSEVHVCSFVLGFELEVVYQCIYALLEKKTHT